MVETTRPAPPADLRDSERDLWLRIVNEKSPDWFDSATVPLLTEYVRLKTQIDLLAGMIDEFTPETLRETSAAARHRGFMQARDRSQKTMSMLATKMRLAQQSRYDTQKAATRVNQRGPVAVGSGQPWQSA